MSQCFHQRIERIAHPHPHPHPHPLAGSPREFRVDETSIAAIHGAIRAGTLTCHALVQAYLRRIDAYDKQGPAINAITVVNPDAIATADSLDRRYAATRQLVGPLHCIPMIVKDNFQTIGLQTAAGNLALKGYTPSKDAFQVKRIKQAGAIVLAKSNMAEFAFSPLETVNSLLPGYTRNPYALDRVTAGSSGGTAAAVAADLGEVGLGTDTGNSIRGPSSHQALVGIRSTMGLASRAGIAPLSLFADIAGPMARSVADAAAVLAVVAGYDPDDPVTERSEGQADSRLLGVARRGRSQGRAHRRAAPSVRGADGRSGGARSVQPRARRSAPGRRDRARHGAHRRDRIRSVVRAAAGAIRSSTRSIAGSREQGDRVPVKSIDSIVRSGQYHPSIQTRLEAAIRVELPPDSIPGCQSRQRVRDGLREAVTRTMDRLQLDALVYPTWSNPPRLIGDMTTPAGDNSQVFSPTTGMPAITVPMGYTRNNTLPAGMTIFGRAFDEPRLIKLAYGYEQSTKWRRQPVSTPPM